MLILRKGGLFFACLLVTLPLWAHETVPVLNEITLSLKSEQWVTTTSALVSVDINAAVSDQGIGNVQANAMQHLKQLSSQGDWHLVSFSRKLDKSGLENLQIIAQARLPQPDLINLRNKAKAISKPGETFSIDQVQFTPSNDEMKQATIALRNNIYQQAKLELDALNKLYPEQRYFLHKIDFVSAPPPFLPGPVSTAMVRVGDGSEPVTAATPLPIGDKAELQATVVLASAFPSLSASISVPESSNNSQKQ